MTKKLRVQNNPYMTSLSNPKLDPNLRTTFSNQEEHFHEYILPRFGTKAMPHQHHSIYIYLGHAHAHNFLVEMSMTMVDAS